MEAKTIDSELELTDREEAIMHEAFMTGRIYANCGEKETPDEIDGKLLKKCKLKANGIRKDGRAASELKRLLACPFCGGEAAMNETTTYDKETIRLNGQDTFHGVNCIYCGVNNKGLLGYKTKKEAVENWNKRVAS